jgi:predicted DNA-binding transcriptional regulator AlpA
MPKVPDLLFASERTAARLLDMKPDHFRDLVNRGHLPPPRRIGDLERFDLAELQAVIRGDKIAGGEMTW